ncbi:Helix-turn-helix domain-containing protein [Actinopolyspora xinjiangensis]|uniref:Helix-turn-helix domain-containing protein n=1 Tax=Actinopolyspora xinjiangensis TaxID=405564 RepID=A0A1H0TQS1_9ACTN|nr:helix-turn-helix transcriptional regulator [Actinopolyspora xinjiangensis]SDP56090.1 Helix-turn-helix domain-containing protein [Actinopolyspora xinjiangensis]
MNHVELPEIPTVSPTVGRRWLAEEVRRLRDAAGLKQSDVAKRLRCGTAKVAHMESMRNTISGPDLEVMLALFEVPADRVEWYLRLAELAKEKGWWDGNRAVPDWFSLYVGLEWGADRIREWELGFPPGILQTRPYVEALVRSEDGPSDVEVRELVEARLRRQEALWRLEDPLWMHAVVDEAALRRRVGDAEVMREQLRYLARAGRWENVTVQVLPFVVGPHRGHLGSFQWLGFPRVGDPGVVYLENQRGGIYLEEVDEVAMFNGVFESLAEQALSPAESAEFLSELAKEIT